MDWRLGEKIERLALMEEFLAMEPRDHFWEWLQKLPAFLMVADDPAFITAGTPVASPVL